MTLTVGNQTLSVGGAASGISTSDVATLIKNNTPYQFIAKVDAAGGTTVDFSNSLNDTDGFSAYRIILDNMTIASNTNNLYMRIASGGTIQTSSIYGWAVVRGNGSSAGQFNQETQDSRWKLTPSLDISTAFFGTIDLNNTGEGVKTGAIWNVGGGGSSRQSKFSFGSGNVDFNAQISGFNIQTNGINFTGGSVRLYGVNNV